jgi:hypothetical protein
MRSVVLSNPLYLAGAVLLALVALVIVWRVIKGAAKVVVILVLLAAIAAAVLWLKGMGPIGH